MRVRADTCPSTARWRVHQRARQAQHPRRQVSGGWKRHAAQPAADLEAGALMSKLVIGTKGFCCESGYMQIGQSKWTLPYLL